LNVNLHSTMPLTFLLAAYFSVAAFLLPPKIRSTEALIDAMHRQYRGKWARTVTFTQRNTHYAADTVKGTSTWYEAIEYPDKFRIDFGVPREGNAMILAEDSMYNFKGGELKARQFRVNELMLLAGGLNFLDKAAALAQMQKAGYNTNIFREDTWEGRKAYVVGAQKGDEKTAQCWFDAQHLYLVRSVSVSPKGSVQDGRFSKHMQAAGGWLETEVLFLVDGKKAQLEEYQDVKINPSLPDGLFTPAHFGKVHWMAPQATDSGK
jgi:hypothetical protein